MRKQSIIPAHIRRLGDAAPLSHDQQLDLVRRAKAGDKRAADQLVRTNSRFIMKAALRFGAKDSALLEDLFNEGALGLLRAVELFDESKGVKFLSYAALWVRAYINNYAIETSAIVSFGHGPAERTFFFKAGRVDADDPNSVATVAAEMGMKGKEDQVAEMSRRLQAGFSLNRKVLGRDGDSFEFVDHVEGNLGTPEEHAMELQEKTRAARLVEEMLASIPERYATILRLRFLGEEQPTLEEMSKVTQTSRERVRQLVLLAIGKATKFFGSREVPGRVVDLFKLYNAERRRDVREVAPSCRVPQCWRNSSSDGLCTQHARVNSIHKPKSAAKPKAKKVAAPKTTEQLDLLQSA